MSLLWIRTITLSRMWHIGLWEKRTYKCRCKTLLSCRCTGAGRPRGPYLQEHPDWRNVLGRWAVRLHLRNGYLPEYAQLLWHAMRRKSKSHTEGSSQRASSWTEPRTDTLGSDALVSPSATSRFGWMLLLGACTVQAAFSFHRRLPVDGHVSQLYTTDKRE